MQGMKIAATAAIAFAFVLIPIYLIYIWKRDFVSPKPGEPVIKFQSTFERWVIDPIISFIAMAFFFLEYAITRKHPDGWD